MLQEQTEAEALTLRRSQQVVEVLQKLLPQVQPVSQVVVTEAQP